jgi:adenylosuccinate lyase
MGREGAHKIIKEYAVKAVDEMRTTGSHQFIKELGADQEFLLSEEDLNKILGDRASFFGGAKDQVVRVSERINKTLTKYSHLQPFTPNTIR